MIILKSPLPSSSCIYGAAANSDSSWAQKRLLGHRYTSSHPENCFYPLPSSSQPPQHQPDGADYHQDHAGEGSFSSNVQASTTSLQLQDPLPDSSKPRLVLVDWTKPWPGPAEAGFWSSGAADGEGAVQDAASGGSSEAQEDSTTSAYDNLDRVSSHQRMEDVTGERFETNDPGDDVGTCEEKEEPEDAGQRRDSSSCSSCEVLPLDESTDISPKKPESLSSNQAAEEGNSDHGAHEDINNNNDDDDDDDESVHHLNSPASALSVSLISTGSSEVFLPSGPPDVQGPGDPPQPWEAHSVLGKLQQQMAQQKAEYQARIQRWDSLQSLLT